MLQQIADRNGRAFFQVTSQAEFPALFLFLFLAPSKRGFHKAFSISGPWGLVGQALSAGSQASEMLGREAQWQGRAPVSGMCRCLGTDAN